MNNKLYSAANHPQSDTAAPGVERTRRESGTEGAAVSRVQTQVVPSGKRRRLTAQFKMNVIQRVSRLREENSGEIGAYLRSQGLYYANVTRWEQQLENGTLGVKRGPMKTVSKSDSREKVKLKRIIQQLEKKLETANALIELQKKISDLMGLQQESMTE